MANEKVTVRFETNSTPSENEPILLSGPIDIFATVDTLYDADGIARPTSDDLGNLEYQTDGVFDLDKYMEANEGVKISLLSPYLIELAEEELAITDKQVIVFVENVGNPLPDNQNNRGAYFFYQGFKTDPSGEKHGLWQEILLGTHSHANAAKLEEFEGLGFEYIKDKSIIIVKEDGKLELVDVKSIMNDSGLPELPAEIKAKLQKIKDYEAPTDSENHHLDAPLDELKDTYDWLRMDKNGNYTNLAIGNCRDLYRELAHKDKKLFLQKNDGVFSLSTENGNVYLQLEAFKINYSLGEKFDDCLNVVQDKRDATHNLLEIEFNEVIQPNDVLFFFDGDEGRLLTKEFEVLQSDVKKVILLLNSEYFNYDEPRKLTVLIAKDAGRIPGFKSDLALAFEKEELKLCEINNELVKLYIAGEFSRKPTLPSLYLATDEYGNMNWTNKLLPAQYFYAKQVVVKPEDIGPSETEVKVRFDNANYDIESDFPLLLINDSFAFNYYPDAQSGVDVIYRIPTDDIDSYGVSRTEETKITLVLIKKSTPGSIADEVARNYVSKADAIAILSHGRIKLDDYAKKSDLFEFASLRHTHSQYALKNHDHDYRYANFQHTHPELIEATAQFIANVSDSNVDEIRASLENMAQENQDKYTRYIDAIIRAAGILIKRNDNGVITEAVIPDENIILTPDTIESLNKTLVEDGLEGLVLSSGASVKDAIKTLALLFQKDTVEDYQVLLSDPIRASVDIGGIKKGTLYQKDSDLRQILTDLLNPFVSKEKAYEILRPTNVELEWYTLNSDGETFTKIDAEKLLRLEIEQNPVLYFKILHGINQYGNCVLDTNYLGENILQEVKITVKDEEDVVYHRYEITDLELEDLEKIDFEWIPKFGNHEGEIFDNYGLDSFQGLTKKLLQVRPVLKYTAPAMFIGNYRSCILDNSVISDHKLNNVKSAYPNDKFQYTITGISGENRFIILLMQDKFLENGAIIIKNIMTGNRIEDYFYPVAADTYDGKIGLSENDKEYTYSIFCYEVYSSEYDSLPVNIKLISGGT